MKKFIPIIAFAAMITACNTNSQPGFQDTGKSSADTTGLAEFKNWKTEQALKDLSEYKTEVAASVPKRTTSGTKRSSGTNHTVQYSTTTSNAAYSDPVVVPEKKKGWSKAAKGAAIGGASGAVLGAVIDKKNRAIGAVIGGVVGGGVGYGVGRTMDKKDGRY
jgi:hypothetical protein